jgi:hypothetical protein
MAPRETSARRARRPNARHGTHGFDSEKMLTPKPYHSRLQRAATLVQRRLSALIFSSAAVLKACN